MNRALIEDLYGETAAEHWEYTHSCTYSRETGERLCDHEDEELDAWRNLHTACLVGDSEGPCRCGEFVAEQD